MPTLYKRYGNNSDITAALMLVMQAVLEKLMSSKFCNLLISWEKSACQHTYDKGIQWKVQV